MGDPKWIPLTPPPFGSPQPHTVNMMITVTHPAAGTPQAESREVTPDRPSPMRTVSPDFQEGEQVSLGYPQGCMGKIIAVSPVKVRIACSNGMQVDYSPPFVGIQRIAQAVTVTQSMPFTQSLPVNRELTFQR